MLFKIVLLLSSIIISQASPIDVISSSTDTTEFGAYVNPNPKNICEGEELETLTICASEVLSKLDECKPDDLACECCALQSMKRDCYGLCPNTASGNFLAVLYDDCETMNDVNACNLPFKKHDTHVAKFLRPNSRLPVEEKEPDFVIKSIFENNTITTNTSIVSSFINESKFDGLLDDTLNVSNSSLLVWNETTSSLNSTEENGSYAIAAPIASLSMLQVFFILVLSMDAFHVLTNFQLRV